MAFLIMRIVKTEAKTATDNRQKNTDTNLVVLVHLGMLLLFLFWSLSYLHFIYFNFYEVIYTILQVAHSLDKPAVISKLLLSILSLFFRHPIYSFASVSNFFMLYFIICVSNMSIN